MQLFMEFPASFTPVSHLHHHTCASLGSHAVCLAGLSGRAPGGYSWHYMSCPAEDECANGHHGRDVKRQDCVDAQHGYSCRCKQGYELETIHYRDVDDARCVQIIGYIHTPCCTNVHVLHTCNWLILHVVVGRSFCKLSFYGLNAEKLTEVFIRFKKNKTSDFCLELTIRL